MYSNSAPLARYPVRVGLIGTGYAAKLRAFAFRQDERSQLVAVVGHQPDKTATFAQEHQTEVVGCWQELVQREDVDLVTISTVNRDHSAIAHAALTHGKHVIVEYPLALDINQAAELISLAKAQKKLLHVEHIEMLGGLHQALKLHLPKIGQVFFARYNTINPQLPAPRKWSYNHELFGFPLMGALSRLHRLIDLFGPVWAINSHQRYWKTEIETPYYQSCFCTAQLAYQNGLFAEIIYAKGETLWQSERRFEVHGESGGLIFDAERGMLVQAGETIPIEVGSRQGLFAKDTTFVLDHLINSTPLYITPEESLYTLKVADAARRSAELGVTIIVENAQ